MSTMSQRPKKRKKKASKKDAIQQKRGAESAFFVDKDLSLLQFNQRVLEQAQDASMPLLERVKFLTIFHSNLDEFFMKRIGAPRNTALFSVRSHRQDRMTAIRSQVEKLLERAASCYLDSLKPELDYEGIFLVPWSQLKKAEREAAKQIFYREIFPVLTPLAVDPAHPFPHISNQSTSLAVALKTPGGTERSFARVKIPKIFPHWFCLNPEDEKAGNDIRFVSAVDIIQNNLHKLFPNMEIVSTVLFRVIRNIELEADESHSFDDFVEMVEQELKNRHFGEVVKVEYEKGGDPWLLDYLASALGVKETDCYEMSALVDFQSLGVIAGLNIPELKFPLWSPVVPRILLEESQNIFNTISKSDFLVHHPYESFSASVEQYIRAAATDPQVRAIKMTLYRTHDDGSVISALVQAAEEGKEVVCLIELKARFDEERNIEWADRMEDAGIHVVYGIQGLKIHSKLALVVRQESEGVKCYCHIGTGNYHGQTAKLYTDYGLFTADPKVTSEVVELFNFLTGKSLKRDYRHLLVAPINLKDRLMQMVDDEIAHHKAGRPSGVIVKCNGLDEPEFVHKLYQASKAGVKIDLMVRGICTLKPGVKGLSENIRVTSIVDRFLEHSRVFYFRSGEENPSEGRFFLGSADCMYRNLLRRVEVVTPIFNRELCEQIYIALEILLQDDWQTWEMRADGSYKRLGKPSTKDSSQQLLAKRALLMSDSYKAREKE